jgi:hypothetical protein
VLGTAHGAIDSARSDAGGDIAARCPYHDKRVPEGERAGVRGKRVAFHDVRIRRAVKTRQKLDTALLFDVADPVEQFDRFSSHSRLPCRSKSVRFMRELVAAHDASLRRVFISTGDDPRFGVRGQATPEDRRWKMADARASNFHLPSPIPIQSAVAAALCRRSPNLLRGKKFAQLEATSGSLSSPKEERAEERRHPPPRSPPHSCVAGRGEIQQNFSGRPRMHAN